MSEREMLETKQKMQMVEVQQMKKLHEQYTKTLKKLQAQHAKALEGKTCQEMEELHAQFIKTLEKLHARHMEALERVKRDAQKPQRPHSEHFFKECVCDSCASQRKMEMETNTSMSTEPCSSNDYLSDDDSSLTGYDSSRTESSESESESESESYPILERMDATIGLDHTRPTLRQPMDWRSTAYPNKILSNSLEY